MSATHATRSPLTTISILAAGALLCSACASTHGLDGDHPTTAYEIDPAPREGGEHCPALPGPPADCESFEGGLCTLEALSAALANAQEGDVVRVGRCHVSGPIAIPPGVTLMGVDRESSVIEAATGGHAISLSTEMNASPSVVRCLGAEANALAAIVTEGDGDARVEFVHIDVMTGSGVEARGLRRLSLHELQLQGPVTPDNAESQPVARDPSLVGALGVVVEDIGQTTVYRLAASGFATAGAVFINTRVSIRGAEFRHNMGTGAAFSDSDVCARGIQIERTLSGFQLAPQSGLLIDGGSLNAAELSIIAVEGTGLVIQSSEVQVDGLIVEGNERAGVSILGGQVQINDARLIDNHFVGLFSCQASSLTITDTEISGTRSALRAFGLTDRIELGAGLLVGATEAIALSGLRAVDNATVGVELDLSGGAILQVEGVLVSGSGDALGAVAFDESGWLESGGWDENITREGATVDNDALPPDHAPEAEAFGCPGLSP